MFSGLDVERILWSCQAIGIAQAVDAAHRYAKSAGSHATHHSFQMIQDKLANMLVEIDCGTAACNKGLVSLD